MARTNAVYIDEGSPSSVRVPVDVVEHGSIDILTTTTADPGSGGVSLAVTLRNLFPQSGNFKIAVEDEIMEVTAGHGTGAGSFTVTRGIDGTTAVAHASGVTVAQIVGTQRVVPVGDRRITWAGRAMSFRTPGRAGTAGQKILSLHNATGSKIKVRVNYIIVDLAVTVAKAITVLPPVIRVWKVTVLPTNGTALTKVPKNSSFAASSSSVTVLGDASADGTGSGTALAATLPAGAFYTQEYAPRMITGAGYEMFDREEFLEQDSHYIDLNALEGVVLFVDYVLATQNPTTDMWIGGIEWEEYVTT